VVNLYLFNVKKTCHLLDSLSDFYNPQTLSFSWVNGLKSNFYYDNIYEGHNIFYISINEK